MALDAVAIVLDLVQPPLASRDVLLECRQAGLHEAGEWRGFGSGQRAGDEPSKRSMGGRSLARYRHALVTYCDVPLGFENSRQM